MLQWQKFWCRPVTGWTAWHEDGEEAGWNVLSAVKNAVQVTVVGQAWSPAEFSMPLYGNKPAARVITSYD